MQKTITLKDFKVFLLKSFLPILILSISFQVSFAQNGSLTKPASAKLGQPTEKPAIINLPVNQAKMTQKGYEAKKLQAQASFQATDVPVSVINTKIEGNHFSVSPQSLTNGINPSTPSVVADVCTFSGGLVAGDATLTAGRPFRGGVSSSCAAPGACGAPFGTGPYFYDTYTMTNLTCQPQCVSVNYIANAGGGNVFVTAYLNSFNPASICTNRIADGGSSSLSAGAAVNFSFNLAANATVVFVVNEATISEACPSYTMTVTGLNCTPPPVCIPPTSSILSQAQVILPPVDLFNEGFNSGVPFPANGLPAGWTGKFLSQPIGSITVWYSGVPAVIGPHSGASYIAANFNHAGAALGTLSSWMFAPSVLLQNGDKFSFWTVHDPGNARPDRLQVRLNTTNTGTNVGATATSVGDFTTLLLDINPTYQTTGYPTAWTQFTVTMSGLPAGGVNGVVAFRYFCENSGGVGVGQNSDYIGIDDVKYSTFPTINPTTCTGSIANLKVDITGGNSAAYNVTINANPPGAGGNFTINNYVSGDYIPVTPAAPSTTYSLVSVVSSSNACCIGSGNSGTPTITVSPTPVIPIAIIAAPDVALCAGNPTLLTAVGGSPIIPVTVSQSTSQTPTAGSVACNSGGVHTDNSYWRVYDLSTYPLAGPLTINAVRFGIELAAGGPQNVIARLYTQTGAAFPGGTRTLIATQTYSIPNQTLSLYTATLTTPVTVAATDKIVVELFTPAGAPSRRFFIGSNSGGQAGLSYISAAACGAANPTNLATLGFPNMHIILNILGTTGTGSFPLPAGWTVLWTPAAGLSNVISNPVAASPMTTTTYTVVGTAPDGCQTSARKTIVINQLPAVVTDPANKTICATTNVTFTVGATGATITYQWQESTNGGVLYTNIANGGIYSGATSATLTLTGVTPIMNNNLYRCVISGICPPAATSAGAILKVNALPIIAITPASPVCGGIAGTNGTLLSAGSAPPPIPGSLTVNSGPISVAIPDNNLAGATHNIAVAGIPANATISGMSVKFNMTHTWNGDMVFALKAPNGSILNLDYYLSGTGGTGATTGFVNTNISSAGVAALSSGSGTYTGTFKADAVLTGAFGPAGPTGFIPTVTSFPGLFTTPNNGNYTLAMYDGGGGDLGILTSWEIKIDYTTPGATAAPLTYTWFPATGLYSDANATIPYIAGTQANSVYAAPVVTTLYTVTGTDGITGCVNTGTISVIYTPKAPIVSPAAPSMCLGDVAIPLSITSSLAPSPFTTTYSSGTISVPIPDNSLTGATSTMAVPLPATAAITSMTAAFNITHTWAGDLVVVLQAPNNKILNLDYYISTTGGAGPTAGFTNTRISSTGTAALSTGANPYNAIFKADAIVGNGAFGPSGPTGLVANTSLWSDLYSVPNGNWKLGMYDGGGGDVGTLTSWSLTFNYLYGPPAAGVWSPGTGLWLDAAATVPYAGTSVNTVYARPGVSTTYSVTVASPGPDAIQTFSNPAAITIRDNNTASPYPSNITASGLPTTGVAVKSVTLTGLSHTWSDDIDVVLQSPTGTNVVLMSDVGGAASLSNVSYTFDDAAAGTMNITAANATGTYKPTNGPQAPSDNWPAPGPGAFVDPTPALANFTGNPNGIWKLFIVDDTGGDQGSISGGYSITFSYPTVGCTSAPVLVPVTVNVPVAITAQPVNAAVCTDKVTSFSVTVTGTSPTYQWQVSTDNGNNWTNVSNGGVYAGTTTATVTITAPPVSMSNYLYRCIVSGKAPCGSVTTLQRALTVNPLPTITIAASPYKKLFPGLRTTLFSTVTPAAASYTWLRNGIAVPNAGASSLLIDVDGLGDYRLRVIDVNGCVNTSNEVSLTDSISGRVFIYPNPNSGQFQVRYYSIINNSRLPRGINIFDARGKRIATQTYSIGSPYARMDVDLRNHGTGVYWIEVVDVTGNRLAMGRAEVLR